jgi:hypothetical protein
MSTIARNSRFTRPPLSDVARRRCEPDEIGLECDEPLPHIEPAASADDPSEHTHLPEGQLYASAGLAEERPRRPRRRG